MKLSYIKLPNEILDMNMTAKELAVIFYLSSIYASGRDTVCVKQSTIAKKCVIKTTQTVSKITASLPDKGLITCRRCLYDNNSTGMIYYTLRLPTASEGYFFVQRHILNEQLTTAQLRVYLFICRSFSPSLGRCWNSYNRGTCTSTHYIRVDFLEQVVLGEIRRLTKFASRYEDDFLKAVIGSSQESVALNRRLKEKELAALQARDEELDGLFERIYEDNVSGKLSDERFAKMSRRYETEQKELSEKIKALRSEMEKLSSKTMTTDMFISTVRKYTRAKKLTPRMLNELIERIEVHQAEKVDGEWIQKLTIHYNCVGAIFIPDILPLPVPDVSVNTRKGVIVSYAPNKRVVKNECSYRFSDTVRTLVVVAEAGFEPVTFGL